jgi:hypothetical protein
MPGKPHRCVHRDNADGKVNLPPALQENTDSQATVKKPCTFFPIRSEVWRILRATSLRRDEFHRSLFSRLCQISRTVCMMNMELG